MSRTKKIVKKPETISDFQALLDANKDKMSEGDYLALCNGMKSMFEKEEKENSMIMCKVRTLTNEIDFNPHTGYKIKAVESQVLMNLSKVHYDKLCDKISKHQMVELPHDTHTSKITLYEIPCKYDSNTDLDCDCGNCVSTGPMEFQRNVVAPTYITYVYPREEWESQSELSRGDRLVVGDHSNRRAITHVFD